MRAIRLTNFSDSITQGPRIKAGRFPPSVTDSIASGFGFILTAADFEPIGQLLLGSGLDQFGIGRNLIERRRLDREDGITTAVVFGIQFHDLAERWPNNDFPIAVW